MEEVRWPGGSVLNEIKKVGEPFKNGVGEEGEIGGSKGVEAGSAVASVAAGVFEVMSSQRVYDELGCSEDMPAVFPGKVLDEFVVVGGGGGKYGFPRA